MKSLFQMAAQDARACASEMATMALMLPVRVLTQVSGKLSEQLSEPLRASQYKTAQATPTPDQNPAATRITLIDTEVKLRLLGAIANVVVTRKYRNQGSTALAGLIVCSASTGLYAIKLRLGDRVLRSGIRAPGAAKTADPAPASKRIMLALCQIRPDQEISLELRYTQLLCGRTGE
ncbi:hypothetical protein [Undibacterium sp. Ren11W]|uniref:hypothetical protein n=1 Tax=Undibacterium sp. Ren11W TaxID=3413045 RepID=UPI003BF01A9A